MTFFGLAHGPEQLLNGAQVRAVTLCCSRHLIVTFLGPGGGHEWLQKGVRVSAVTLHCSRLLSVTFLGLVGRPELLLKRAQIRAVTLWGRLVQGEITFDPELVHPELTAPVWRDHLPPSLHGKTTGSIPVLLQHLPAEQPSTSLPASILCDEAGWLCPGATTSLLGLHLQILVCRQGQREIVQSR